MTINTSNTINPIYEFINSKIDSNSVKNISELKKEFDYETFLKYTSNEKKNLIVSEKADDNPNQNRSDVRFHENTPIARPLESSTIFNETKKVFNKRTRRNFTSYNYSEEAPQNTVESKNEKGFYIIIDGMIFQPATKNEELSYIQKRINKVYHINYTKDPGTLVNVIA